MTVIKFSTSSCQPCRQLKPMFDKLKLEYPSINFQEIEVDTTESDEEFELVTKFKIQTVPTMLFLDSAGTEIGREKGVDLSGRKYKNLISKGQENG